MGREDTLRELHEILERENEVWVCAVAGMGGIGKTELAVQYALRNQNDYPGGVCWINCRADIAGEILRYYQVNLGLTIPDELEFEAKVSYCWSHWIEGKALLVFDDVQDEQNNDNDFEKYYPKGQSKFKVLVTSRHRLGTNFSRINLEVLAEDAAIELLKSIVKDGRIESQLTEAKALCQWLGYLPLGLELVGRYLELDVNLNIKTVQKRLERKKLQAQELIHTQQIDMRDMTAKLGVAAAFELSWDRLSEDAKNLGCRLSLFAPVAFNWEWVEECVFGGDAMKAFKMVSLMIERQDEAEAEVTRFLEALQQQGMEVESLEDVIEGFKDEQEGLRNLRNQELGRNSLLEAYVGNQYRFHPLLREFFFSKLSQLALVDDYKRSFARVMVKVAQIIPHNPTKDLLESVSLAIPHLQEVAEKLTDTRWLDEDDLIEPLTRLNWFYQGQGDYTTAEKWSKKCLTTSKRLLGENHPHVATSLNNLALLYYSQGRYENAEPLYLQALELFKRLLGENHPSVANSLNNLALLYKSQGRYEEAEPLYLQALELRKRLFGDNHLDVANSLNNLAELYCSSGKYEDAKPLYSQALELYKRLLGDNHQDVATSLNNLAALYNYQGRYADAEPLYLQALELRKRLLGNNHFYLANSLNGLAGLYHSQGKYAEAEPLYAKALQICEQSLGIAHPNTMMVRGNYAMCLRREG